MLILRDAKAGFTLVELSIVLIVIGLIVGGILTGREMTRAAQIRNMVADLQRIQTSVNAFYDKYRQLPGDMYNASTYWPSESNGDGDFKIGENAGVPNDWSVGEGSQFFFSHLNASGLLPRKNGNTGTSARGTALNDQVVIYTAYNGLYCSGVYGTPCLGRNALALAYASLMTGSWTEAAITGQMAYEIDSKMDDGKPASGSTGGVHGYDDPGTTILSCFDAPTNQYIIDDSIRTCRQYYFYFPK